MAHGPSDGWRLAAGLTGIVVVALVFSRWLPAANATTVATALLLVVLVVAASSRLWVGVTTSVAAMLAFNFAFLPPIGTFTVADPQNWIALAAFLAVSLVASNLSAVARTRTDEARTRRDELARLFDLSRDVLIGTDSRDALSSLARAVSRRFDLAAVAIAVPHGDDWEVFDAGASLSLDRRELASAFAAAQTTLEFDARARAYAGHRMLQSDGQPVRVVPLRVGTRPVGLLAAAGRPIEAGTLDALAGVVAIGIERARFLEERKAAEFMRQSEQLKTALLASLSHDLRTPLTAIRVAAANLTTALSDRDRAEQSDVIEVEVDRLDRLFENVLEMTRIDAGGLATAPRPTHPSEIVAAARDQAGRALRGHLIHVAIDHDEPVQVDPRLTATALARILENAAQYAPAGTAIDVDAGVDAAGLSLSVRDHGPGLAPSDLPQLFERFYRGASGQGRTSGTGMGLWIALRLLEAQGGRVWAENAADGGARFTAVVPAPAAVAAQGRR